MRINMTGIFYAIVASSIVIGVILMFAVNLAVGAIFIVCDFISIGIVYTLVFKTAMKNEKLSATGQPAQARILSIKDTGVVVNEEYRRLDLTLEVQPEKGEPYEVQTTGLVHPIRMASFQPGETIKVMVDPSNRLDVAIDSGEAGGPAGTTVSAPSEEQKKQIVAMLDRNEEEKQAILAKGIEAKAVILKAFELGINVNGKNPAMQFLVEVLPEDGEPFNAQATGVIAETSFSKYQAGMTITVKYDPDDLSRVAILHSGDLASPGA